MEDADLFSNLQDEDGQYNAHAHLAQMVSVFGPPPTSLVKRAKYASKKKWEPKFQNHRGELCSNASEFFGGPFFDGNGAQVLINCIPNLIDPLILLGALIRKDLIQSTWTLADRVTLYRGNEKGLFLDFIGKMLRWHPKERLTAKELLSHPFLVMEDEFYQSYDILGPRKI